MYFSFVGAKRHAQNRVLHARPRIESLTPNKLLAIPQRESFFVIFSFEYTKHNTSATKPPKDSWC